MAALQPVLQILQQIDAVNDTFQRHGLGKGCDGVQLIGVFFQHFLRVFHRFHHHHVAQHAGQLAGQQWDAPAALIELLHLTKGGIGIVLSDGLGQTIDVLPSGDAHRLCHMIIGNLFAAAAAGIQNAQGVSHSAIRQPANEEQPLSGGFDALLVAHILEPSRNICRGDSFKIEPLATGENGRCNFISFGGGQHEHHVFRWLFQQL